MTECSAAARAALLSAVTLAPCVPHPGKIISLGVNYVDHAKEAGYAFADCPAFIFSLQHFAASCKRKHGLIFSCTISRIRKGHHAGTLYSK